MSKQKVNCAKGTREADLGHAVLSASGSHRWLNCTPSARLELEFENTTSEAAREGTAAHALCEHKLKKFLKKRSIINIDHQLQRIGSMEYHIESTKTNAGTRKLPMTEDVFRMFRAILEDRPTDFPEIMVDGYVGFLFRDKNGMPEVALHWEHRLKNAVNRYNSIFRVQLPKITPHICRHTYCSNQAKAGMNPKTLQYLMGHSDIGVTMNTYTHLSLDDAKNEMIRMEELEQARKEVDKAEDKKPMKQNMFKVV